MTERTRVLSGREGVSEAVSLLRGGQVVALPTETVYGLAGNAFDPIAVARIFEAKGRPLSDPLIVHLPDPGWIGRVALLEGNEEQGMVERLAEAFWPGPLTLLLPRHPDLPELVTSGSDHVAVRVTSHFLFQEVLRMSGLPLAAPSANLFGRISPTSAEDVRNELGGRISLILDGGRCLHGVESTILALEQGGLKILRPGPISKEDLIPFGHLVSSTSHGSTPGSLPGHYAPRKPLQIYESDIPVRLSKERIGWIPFRDPEPLQKRGWGGLEILSPSGDLKEAAANLYGALRRLDQSSCESLLVEALPEEGIGVAIMDRLRRAEYGSKHGIGHPFLTHPPIA